MESLTTQAGGGGDHLTARQPGKVRKLAGDVPDLPLDGHRVALRVHPQRAGRPAGGPDHVHQQPDGRGLPGAIWTEEAENTLALDLQVELEETTAAAIVLGQLADQDGWGRHAFGAGTQAWSPFCTSPGSGADQ